MSSRTSSSSEGTDQDPPLRLNLGNDEFVIHQRYETASILNDVLIGTWFLVGSCLFFFPSTTEAGTWLFVIGSLEMLIRPVIRVARRIHLKQNSSSRSGADARSQDF